MPKNCIKKLTKSVDRKTQITLAGLRVFCQKGYDGTTVDDIVKQANCSHGLFYHYFKSKKDIFDQVLEMYNQKKNDKLIELLNNEPNYTEKLRILIGNLFAEITGDENFAYMYFFFISQKFMYRENNESSPAYPVDRKPPIIMLEEFFAKGQRANEFTNKYSALDCARILFSIIQGATIGYVVAPKDIRKKMKLPNVDFIIDTFANKEVINEEN